MSAHHSSTVYDLQSVKLPYFTGTILKLFVSLVESPLRGLIIPSLFTSAGITEQREREFDEPPTLYPSFSVGIQPSKIEQMPQDEWPAPNTSKQAGFRFTSIYDYARAYRSGMTTPLEVAERFLEAYAASENADPSLRAFIAVQHDDVLRQAEAATKRIGAGKSLSIFDGVPVGVKDEVDMHGYPTTVGTSFIGNEPAQRDSTVVARMRAAGALLVGKTNMHEIGIGVTGLNPHHGTPRNPYNPVHFTGASSSGSSAATAAGLCPLAIGADGGGSIRIPASFCGLVGLKSTFGRVSEFGAAPLAWSVAHLGAVAGNASDAALAYAVLAGPDLKDPISQHQPAPSLVGWDDFDLSALRFGVYWPWFEHATDEVVSVCKHLLEEFKQMGASVAEVTIADLEACRVAHLITLGGEMTQALGYAYKNHKNDFGLDVRINLAMARQFTLRDYVQAQRVRTRLIANFMHAFEEVDVIVTPTTAITAPPIPSAALPDGESDLTTLLEIIRFTPPGNMTGLPAISFPAGYSEAGLPIGMQIISPPWQEATLLRLAHAAEKVVEKQKPQVFYELLS